MIAVWHVTPTQNTQFEMEAATLDDVTRQLPDGYYSTFRTFDGCTRVLGLRAHLQRLYEPVSAPAVAESSLRQNLHVLLEPYRPGEARVRVVMSRQGQLYVALAPLTPLPRDIYEKGVRTETTELRRKRPHLKSTSFISRSEAERKHIAEEGIFEALLVRDGSIVEGMTSNFFYVGQVGDPPYIGTARDDILLGVTRETVLAMAQEMGFEVKYQPLNLSQLQQVSEAFITSSSRGVVPVIEIDRITLGQGSPGPITKELSRAYDAYVLENAEPIV